ncbi:MAG: hypothetical protein AB9844_00410 [Clostridiaceae bacterium]
MKKAIMALCLIFIFIFTASACKQANNVTPDGSETGNLNIIPFKDRHFLYTNWLNEDIRQVSTKESGTNVDKSYPEFKGLKNKEIQTKVNQEIFDTLNLQMKDMETALSAEHSGNPPSLNTKVSGASIVYNYNNVVFIEYYTYIDFTATTDSPFSRQKIEAAGYDLNTGNKLTLKDMFKKNNTYEKLINQYISMYIIEHNYDDFDSAFMNRPFQGIRKGQSFSFDITGLKIILDEKNDEFTDPGYPNIITVPIKTIGDELAVFDRYYNGKSSLFGKKGIRKLLPNQVEYKVESIVRESGPAYSLYIENGEFINLSDKKLKALLDEKTSSILNPEEFRSAAKAYSASNPGEYYGNMGHQVNLVLNAGGYLSMLVSDVVYTGGKTKEYRRFMNYDFNRNKEMKLKDLFAENFDYKSAISKILQDRENYPLLSDADISALSEGTFYFDEYGLNIYLELPQKNGSDNYYWIPYEKIGWENIILYQ